MRCAPSGRSSSSVHSSFARELGPCRWTRSWPRVAIATSSERILRRDRQCPRELRPRSTPGASTQSTVLPRSDASLPGGFRRKKEAPRATSPLTVNVVPEYQHTMKRSKRPPIAVERVQTGVRLEKRILRVLKAIAELHDMTLGDLLEGIVLHAFEGKAPFGRSTLKRIEEF